MTESTLKFLIVDDFSLMRRIIRNILREIGYRQFDEAEDGEAALARLKAEGPAFGFILSDIQMPRMDGIQLLHEIRSDERLAQLPVLLVTAEVTPKIIETATQAGADGYITKPFTSEMLRTEIEEILRKRGSST